MRDGHPGARGRERGCGAARSMGRPYSGPMTLKRLVSLPGMVAWQCAQLGSGSRQVEEWGCVGRACGGGKGALGSSGGNSTVVVSASFGGLGSCRADIPPSEGQEEPLL